MSDKFTLSVGQAHELELAMNRAGNWDTILVKEACKGNNLGLFRDVLRGYSFITTTPLIDADADPLSNRTFRIKAHQNDEKFIFNPAKIKLYLSLCQKDKKLDYYGTREEVTSGHVLNACVLDFLLAYPRLIPKEWEGKVVFFFGTLYCDTFDSLFVRSLHFHKGEWLSEWVRYNTIRNDNYFAAFSYAIEL